MRRPLPGQFCQRTCPVPLSNRDLAPNDAGLQAGYLNYPKDQIQTVARMPGLGGDVTAISSLIGPPSPSVDQNLAWEAVNKQLNASSSLTAQRSSAVNGPGCVTSCVLPDMHVRQLASPHYGSHFHPPGRKHQRSNR